MILPSGDSLNKDDIVQIHPKDPVFGSCFAVVTEARGWGCIASVRIPGQGDAPIRLAVEEFEKVGKAFWVEAE